MFPESLRTHVHKQRRNHECPFPLQWVVCLLAAALTVALPAFAAATAPVKVPISHPKGQEWRYTITTPDPGWEKPDFDDGNWKKGQGAFGSPGMGNTTIRTNWLTPDIWIRRYFNLEKAPAGNTQVLIYHDEDAEVSINGVLACQTKGFVGDYIAMPMSPAAKAALKVGPNVLAVHCHQTAGGQCIDVGLGQKLGPRGLSGDDLKSAVFSDWILQDAPEAAPAFMSEEDANLEKAMVGKVLKDLGGEGQAFQAELDTLVAAKAAGNDPQWRTLYTKVCEARRGLRLKPLLAKWQKFAFAKHWNVGGSHYAYTECQSDAQAERNWIPGTALCILEQTGLYGEVQTLIDDPKGVIRNPDVSYDGTKILFAWKKDDRKDDYHLYEWDVATKTQRQVTDGLGFADYEGCYLPTGDIIFSSTRCVQIVDCWWTEVSNLYTCNKDGKYLRRLGYDQVHTNFPTPTDDGRVLYTRWDYNDRGQLYPQPLFQMFMDGTAQTECYGNNSWFPTTIIHARQIPGTAKIVSIATGHHSDQSGKLLLIDPAKGRQENEGAQLIAPPRPTKADIIDGYGQDGEQFQYPYPLDETHYLLTYSPLDPGRCGLKGFGMYFMDIDGKRELLAWDPKVSCNQAIPLAPRPRGHIRPGAVNYHKTTGTYYVQDVYIGPGLKGVARGTIESLRVVALEFRAAGIGSNGNGGPGGGALVSTPVSINNGTWDVKRVLGTVPVEEDGSAYFVVPALTPVYFQLLDEKNYVVQSMRTWSTLQPGETFSCVGCHENKNGAPPTYSTATPKALQKPPRELQPFYGPPRGFSFITELQPILDRSCISCHDDRSKVPTDGKPQKGDVADARIPTTASHCQGSLAAPSDGVEPKCSIDHAIPRFTWWPHKGTKEWIQYDFKTPASAKSVEVYWFDDTGQGGCRVPKSWKLLYRYGNEWKPVANPSAYGVERDKYNKVTFDVVTTAALRIEVELGKDFSGGILKWKVPGLETAPLVAAPAASNKTDPKLKAFSLLGEPTIDNGSKRKWSDAYLALTQRGRPNRIVNWLNVQSIPPMLPPYTAGAAKSDLMTILEKGHYNVKLTREDMDKIACWIDLLVPFCGDYREANAWSPDEMKKYDRYYNKRKAEEEQERRNIEEMLAGSLTAAQKQ
ncbi:MAG: hypothetical protein NTW87_14900 [Planctomycetota bacterium]|nr:hypothetical protein [Planctomycetota bacterium]